MFLKLNAVGHLGKDAIVRNINPETDCISFSLAHSEKWTTKAGEPKEKTTWLDCSYFVPAGKTAVAQYLTAGTIVLITGTPEPHLYQNKEGFAAVSLQVKVGELKLISSKAAEPAAATKKIPMPPAATQPQPQAVQATIPGVPVAPTQNETDDLPF